MGGFKWQQHTTCLHRSLRMCGPLVTHGPSGQEAHELQGRSTSKCGVIALPCRLGDLKWCSDVSSARGEMGPPSLRIVEHWVKTSHASVLLLLLFATEFRPCGPKCECESISARKMTQDGPSGALSLWLPVSAPSKTARTCGRVQDLLGQTRFGWGLQSDVRQLRSPNVTHYGCEVPPCRDGDCLFFGATLKTALHSFVLFDEMWDFGFGHDGDTLMLADGGMWVWTQPCLFETWRLLPDLGIERAIIIIPSSVQRVLLRPCLV